MSRRLDDLSPAFKPLACLFLARLVEARIPVVIVDTLRTKAEQEANIRNGVSWTTNSRHLTGDAIDVCPFEEYALNGRNKLNWDSTNAVWDRIAAIAESCGLVSGHRWKQKDSGHVEMPRPAINQEV